MYEKNKIKKLKKFIEDEVFFESQDEEYALLEKIDEIFSIKKKKNTKIELYDEFSKNWKTMEYNSLKEIKKIFHEEFYVTASIIYRNCLYIISGNTAWLFREVQE